MASKAKVVDIHTHMYPPDYIEILRRRTTIPLVRSVPNSRHARLVLLEAEVPLLEQAAKDDGNMVVPGRPLTKHHVSLEQKIAFMDTHGIDISVLSLANPWLDFVGPTESGAMARSVNAAFSGMCAQHPGRLFFFATLPLTAPPDVVLAAVAEVRHLPYCRGVILGTSGLGKGDGLDDAALLPLFGALAAAELPVFLHPHYGLPNEVFGPRAARGEYGHVLPLALGFPVETTIAVARMYLAGTFDAVPGLRLILAHSGGALPFLAGRIESCVMHDGHLMGAGKPASGRRTVWDVLREHVYLDAVVYSETGLTAAAQAACGTDRLMFGTDHPFFPPLGSDEDGEWESVALNVKAVRKALGEESESAEAAGVMGGNAIRVLRLYRTDREAP